MSAPDSEDVDAGPTRVGSMPSLDLDGTPHALFFIIQDGAMLRLGLVRESTVLGRAPEADLRVDFTDVSRRHCKITKTASGYTIEDLGSSGGTFVRPPNGPEVKVESTTVPLVEHAVVRIGKRRLTFVIPREIHSDDYPKLFPVNGGMMVQLAHPVVTVGRSNADVVLADQRVSTKHAIIETFGKNSSYIIDQRSANGTTVNGAQVQGAWRLEENDVVAFAGIAYRVSFIADDSRTMIGVVSASGTARPKAATGTLRPQDFARMLAEKGVTGEMETLRVTTGEVDEEESSAPKQPSTGTFTGPRPTDANEAVRIVKEKASVEGSPRPRAPKKQGMPIPVRIGLVVIAATFLIYPYVNTVTGECRVAPGAIQKLRAPIAARVLSVEVLEGQQVQAGALLMRLQPLDNSRGAPEDTEVRAGIAGKVVTAAPKGLVNTVVGAGQELLEVDETDRVIAEILVPESDIGDVKLGQKVLARLYTDTTETHESKVTAIMPVAEKGVLGSFVVVKAPLQNKDGRLIPGTTGVAKLVGARVLGIVLLGKKLARIVN